MVKIQLKIPRKIQILGRTWTIKINPKIDKYHGSCNLEKRSIYLTKGWKPLLEVLGHELGHAFCFETNLMKNDEGNSQVLGLFIQDIINQIHFNDTKSKKEKANKKAKTKTRKKRIIKKTKRKSKSKNKSTSIKTI